MTFKHSIVLGVTASLFVGTALANIKISSIGNLSPNAGLNTLRDAEITVEEINAAGGMSDEKLVLISVDTGENITEGVKTYKYLAEIEEVDSIISGSIDDVSLGRLPHMQEFQIPTLDTWVSYIGTIDMVIEGLETMASYFMNIASDEVLATLYTNFGANMLKKEMGWDGVVILAEDTVFGKTVTGLVTEVLGPVAGIETKEIITCDVGTVDFASLFSEVQTLRADFIHQVSLANSRVISPQYVKLRVPTVMTGMNASALGLRYWEDTGGTSSGISTLSPIPPTGFELDPESQKLVDTYQARYDNCPKIPHSNGFNACWGLKRAVAAAKAAGGFGDAKAWSAEMRKQDIALKKDNRMWLRYAFWSGDEVEEVTDRTYPYNARSDLAAPYDDTQLFMVVIQWEEDDEVGVVYPSECVATKFTVPNQVK